MNFKDFNDFKVKLEEMNNNEYQESLNNLFYFFKDQVEKDEYKEWRPDVEVTYFGLDNEFDKGITFTLGEASEFLKTKFFSGKIEAVENFHNDNTKDVKPWSPPDVKVPEAWTPPVQRESGLGRNDGDDLEIDHSIPVDDEDRFNDQENEVPEEEEESFEEFLEDFLGDDDDFDDKNAGSKDKKPRKRKVRVLGEELPFDENGNPQKDLAIEKAKLEFAENNEFIKTLSLEEQDIYATGFAAISADREFLTDYFHLETIADTLTDEEFEIYAGNLATFALKEYLQVEDSDMNHDSVKTGQETTISQQEYSEEDIFAKKWEDYFEEVEPIEPITSDEVVPQEDYYPELHVQERIGNEGVEPEEIDIQKEMSIKKAKIDDIQNSHEQTGKVGSEDGYSENSPEYEGNREDGGGFNQEPIVEPAVTEHQLPIEEQIREEVTESVRPNEIEEHNEHYSTSNDGSQGNVESHSNYEQPIAGNDGLLEIDFDDDWSNGEESKFNKIPEEGTSSINPILGVIGGISMALNGDDYKYQDEDAKLFGQNIEGYDTVNNAHEQSQTIQSESVIDKMLGEDANAINAFDGQGSAGDMSTFGQVFQDFASHMGNNPIDMSDVGKDVSDILNSLVMGMGYTGDGSQIYEPTPDQVMPPPISPTEHIRGVHENISGHNLGVESGINVDEWGRIQTDAQRQYEEQMKNERQIGQDTRDLQKTVDTAIADKEARDAMMTRAYNNEINSMPASTMMQGEDFNRVYMEHFADATAVEFSAAPIPENAQVVDLSFAGNGAVLGYEDNGVLYISAAPPIGSDPSMLIDSQVYLNPDSAGMFKDAVNLQSVSFGDVVDASHVYNMGGMFLNCENLNTVNADYLNTEKLQNIDGIFANCSNLQTLNADGWNTSNVVTASFAFSECYALIKDPSANWRMENLLYADGFMSGCVSLTAIDMSNWNAKSLLTTREMFNGCSSAEYININGLSTANVRDMAGMFKGCENISDVNLSKLSTNSLSPVIESKGGVEAGYQRTSGHPIDDVFYGCKKLTENEEFKSRALQWEANANRAVELNSPVYKETKGKDNAHKTYSSQNSENNRNIEDKNKDRRSEKGNGGHAFGDSKSSNAREIYDSAKLKKDQELYKAKRAIEEFGKGAKMAGDTIVAAAGKIIENPQDDSLLAETTKLAKKGKQITKDIISGVIGVSMVAALKAEQSNFRKTTKVAQKMKDLEKEGLNLKNLQGMSLKEATKTLSGLKDANGKRLLSDKQIREIAKHRIDAVDMVNFDKAISHARNAGLFREKERNSLNEGQKRALERFRRGSLDNLKTRDFGNIADAYFKNSSSEILRNLKPSSLSKSDLDKIISGRHKVIDWNKLSDTEKDIFKGLRQSNSIGEKEKSVKNNNVLKKTNPFTVSNLIKALEKTGNELSGETARLIGTTRRTLSIISRSASTAMGIARIYGGLIRNSKIVIKARGKIRGAAGRTKIGRKMLEKVDIKRAKKAEKMEAKAIRNDKKAAIKQEMKEELKKEVRKGIEKGARRISAGMQRTAAGRAAANMLARIRQTTANSRFLSIAGTVFGRVGGAIALPFRLLGKIGSLVNAVRAAINRLLLYLAAGFVGFVVLVILLLAIISMLTSGSSSGVMANSSIMGPPNVDKYGNELNLTEEEEDERWEDFKSIIQRNYEACTNVQENVLNSIESMFEGNPTINGGSIIGWAGEPISGYENTWITYDETADDNAKDAIAIAYVIMGTKDFYYKEKARDKLIEDLITVMNPMPDEDDITNTINPSAVYADDGRKIYACASGCGSLTYYCADDAACSSFSKYGCVGKTMNFNGDTAVKEMETCVRLSDGGGGIVANGGSIPSPGHPVLYADELTNHTYGDSYMATCTGEESVTIAYEYSQTYKLWYGGTVHPSGGLTASQITQREGYGATVWWDPSKSCWVIPSNGTNLEFPPGGLYTKIEEQGLLYTTLSDLGLRHESEYMSGGIDDSSQVVGPTGLDLSGLDLLSFVEAELGVSNVTSAKFESTPSGSCSSWEVEFECEGHPITTCPNGHTDLGVTVSQYSAEDFTCFGGSKISLPSDPAYQKYVDEFLAGKALDEESTEEEPTEEKSTEEWDPEECLDTVNSIVENDWEELYGVTSKRKLLSEENSKISEAYIYYMLVAEPEDTPLGLGMSDAQAAALLGYMKVASGFQINKKTEDENYYGLCLWDADQLATIGCDLSENKATLLEQLKLLNAEFGNALANCGFAISEDLVGFRSAENTVDGVKKASELLVTKWEYGHVENLGAVQSAAVEYYNKITSGTDKDFANPCLPTICNYVTWALKTASSPEHGYCQGKFQRGYEGDFACGSFCTAAITAGTEGTSDELAGWLGNTRFLIKTFDEGLTEADLQFGDLIYLKASGGASEHIEIYLGKGCSVGARGADGPYGCSAGDDRWKNASGNMNSKWTDHIFHQAGDQGLRNEGGTFSYDEIAASDVDLIKYTMVYRLQPKA